MGMIEDLSRTLDTEDGVRRLTGARNLPAVQAPMYNPESVPRIAGPSGNLPAVQAPWYTPESVPQIAAQPAQPSGPIARAAGMAGRLAGGGAALLAGGAAATESATGTVAANPDYFKSSIGDDGLAANILTASRDNQPQTISGVANAPVTARTQNGPLSVPTIAQMGSAGRGASGDWAAASDAGAGRGSVNPPSAIADVARAATTPQYDDTYRQQNLTNNLNQAYREGDPIGDIIRQRLGQQGGAQQPAKQNGAAVAGGIIGGGDTVYAPGQAARTDPYQTADGRSINPNDANLSADDRSAIGQYKAQNAQALADMERQQRTNPLAGAVQIIRPGNDVSYAVQAPERMVEMEPGAYAQYQSAFAKNPGMGARAQMTEGGIAVDNALAPPNVVGDGDKALTAYSQAQQQDALNKADPLAAATRAKIAESMGDVGMVTGAANPTQAGAAQLTGDDFIKALPQNRGTLVKMIGDGSLQVTPQLLTRNPGLLTQVGQAYPDFDQKDYNSRYQTAVAFNKGKQGDAVRATNQAIAHMGSLNEAIDKLDNFNGVATPLNYIANPIAKAMGDTRPGVFEQKAQAVASELRKVFAGGGGGSLAELEEWRKSLPVNASKEQQKAYLGSGVDLLHGAIDALQSQYDKGMGKAAGSKPLLTPESQKTLDLISGKAAAGESTKAPATAQPTRKTVGDKTYENDGKGWYEVK